MKSLDRISHETMVFMRGRYKLDEIGDGKNGLKFKQGKKTILTVRIREDRFTFLVIFGRKERECFEAKKTEFSQYTRDRYDAAKTYHDGKWVFIDVKTPEQLEDIKKLVQIKKKPNRKPFFKEGAVYAQCGQRCDLCVHYTGMGQEQRSLIIPHLIKMWGTDDWEMRCPGCDSPDCYCHGHGELCPAKACAEEKGIAACVDCGEYPCLNATAADYRSMLHTEIHYAEEITWGILPYVPRQYETQLKDTEENK